MRMLSLMMMAVVLLTLGRNSVLQHVHLRGLNPAAIHGMNPKLGANLQRRSCLAQELRRHARIDQRSQQHVSGNSGKAFNPANFHKSFAAD